MRSRAQPWQRRLLIALGCIVAYGLFGFLAAPALLRWQGEIRLSELLQREVQIDRIAINPFALTVDVYGMRVSPAGAGQSEAGFDQLHANLEVESLIRGGPVLQEFSLIAPQLRLVVLDEAHNNWSDVLERLASRSDPKGGETHFSINNIQLSDGRVEVDDRMRGGHHTLEGLSLGLPFVSNLPAKVSIFVEPSLSAIVDGAAVRLTGRSMPFSETRETRLDLDFRDLELRRYLAYLPFKPLFKVNGGTLSSTLELSFSQPVSGASRLALSGGVSLAGLDVVDDSDRPLLSIGSLELGVDEVLPLARRFVFSHLRVDNPVVALRRDVAGRIGLLDMLPPRATAAADSKPVDSESTAIDFQLAELHVGKGEIAFSDELLAAPFALRLKGFSLDASALTLAPGTAAPFRLEAVGEGGLGLSAEGRLTPADGSVDFQLRLAGAQLAGFAAYYGSAIKGGALSKGVLEAAARVQVPEGDAGRMRVADGRLAIKDLVLQFDGAKRPPIQVGVLEASGVAVDMAARKVLLGQLSSSNARLETIRLADGSFDLQALLGTSRQSDDAPDAASASAKWLVETGRIDLKDWTLRLEDRSSTPHSTVLASGIAIGIDGLSTRAAERVKVSVSSRINRGGQLQAQGTLVIAPFATDLELDLRGIELVPMQPYLTGTSGVTITRGALAARGHLTLSSAQDGPLAGSYRGSASLTDFASLDKLNASDFLRWSEFSFEGVDLALAPFAVTVTEVRLKDLYSKLILDAEGKLNLREIGGGDSSAPAAAVEPGVASGTASEPAPAVKIERVVFEGGNVAFSDHFIRPNYDANLTALGGTLVGLSSDQATLATLELKGQVDGVAPVSIAGSFNPFRDDRALEIDARMTGFDLSAVSSYSGKYVGYGIRKGKLSAKLNYRIVDRKLAASNNIFLDQLTFGDQVDSADAIKAPVLLAVALLKNRRGEIDLDLPLSGSLDDPQFSVGGLVVRTITTLLGKALTAPFALLGSVPGGDAQELAWLEFEPGRASISEKNLRKLEALAKALKDRPALKLEIAARLDPLQDPAGLGRVALERLLKSAKSKRVLDAGGEAQSPDAMVVTGDEYGALLAEVYKAARFERPRNLIGLLKEQPVAEMERMLLESLKPDGEEMRQLARQRENRVRQWLLETGGVETERLFVVSGLDDAVGQKGEVPGARVDFSLR